METATPLCGRVKRQAHGENNVELRNACAMSSESCSQHLAHKTETIYRGPLRVLFCAVSGRLFGGGSLEPSL